MQLPEELLDERTLMKMKGSKKSGTMPIPGSEGAARKDVARAGFRKKGPIQDPKVEKSGKDVPVWVRTHKSPADYAAHTAKQKHKEGEKTDTKELRKQFHKTGAKKDSEVHDITVGSPKSKVKDPGQRARQFVGALKDVKDKMKEKKGVATNTPTAIDSTKTKNKKNRSGEEGAEQRGRIYKKLGMGERNPKTGVQMAKLGECKSFSQFMLECNSIQETSLNRIRSKSEKGGMAIMSAQRGDKSKSENKARSKQLEKDVRGAGLPGPTKVKGRYTENPGTPQEKKVGEKSHVITPGKKGKRKFKKAIEKLGKKYDQDSVLIQRKKGGSATLKGTSKTSWPGKGKNVKIGKMKPGRTGEFDTKVKNKTFTVED
jgi:hypothetical protein